jgi:hypothetical protein
MPTRTLLLAAIIASRMCRRDDSPSRLWHQAPPRMA